MYITKETKLQLSCHCHEKSYAAGPVLITTKIPKFHLTQGSSAPNNLFRGRPPVALKKVANGDIWFFTERLEPRLLPWQQYSRCHFVSFVMFIFGTKFEDNCSKISGDILNSVFYRSSGTIYDVITTLICIIQKPEYL